MSKHRSFKLDKFINAVDDKIKLFGGDVFECLKHLPKNTIQAVITSPTYWGKRNFTENGDSDHFCI
ncbi:hypothetical protein KAW65_04055 [candidate division WOR-3 bacterium]|nr:hypothetical protein [candidate division WOR-3 bacterium]